MSNDQHPGTTNGKICYLEIPAEDIQQSVAFYQNVFGWDIRVRGNGTTAFDDSTGQVSGSWVQGRKPTREAGLLFYIMVDNIELALADVTRNGGRIVQPVGVDAPEITARFTDPGGNLIGLYQEPSGR